MSYRNDIIELIDKTVFTDCKEYGNYEAGMAALVALFQGKKAEGRRLFFAGNGGSAAVATHMTADYLKNGGMRTVSLYNPSVVTCLGNDYGYEDIFSRQLEKLVGSGALLIVISSSGESENIIRAVRATKDRGGEVLALTGFEPENTARKLADMSVYVPSVEYGKVESIHNLILQQAVDEIMITEE